jgi:4-amino-4-deoxy-L-arabinose transferase-like glycosyltransferase
MSTTAAIAAPGESAPPVRHFGRWLAVIAGASLLIAVAAAFYYDRYVDIWGDAVWYSANGHSLVEGKGFIAPFGELVFGKRFPSAAHPPLYPIWLTVPSAFSDNQLYQRLWSSLVVVGIVVVLGLLGREIAGERSGLVAAVLGALSISLVAQSVNLMSEGLFALTILLTVWLSYRFIRAPGLLNAGLLGGAIALASLTRAEGALLFVILLLPLALRARALPMGRRIACVVVGGLVGLVLFSPWLIYNNTGRFDNPVGLSTGLGGLIGSSNCPNTYDGPKIGGWGGVCAKGVTVTINEDETLQDQKLLDAGLEYAGDHADRLPIVIPARIARSFGFYQPVQVTSDDIFLRDGNARIGSYLSQLQYWVYLAFGIVGGVFLWRRKVALLPFVAPVVTVLVITVFGYGTMRFRVALDAILPVLAAIGGVGLWYGRRDRSGGGRRRIPAPGPGAEAGAPEPTAPVGTSARTGTVGSDS